jgi:exopolysaccharide production protein ExoQ
MQHSTTQPYPGSVIQGALPSGRPATIFPWDFRAWRNSLRIAGLPGLALQALLIGVILQVADTGGTGPAHSSTAALVLVRGPMALLALLLLLFRPRVAKVGLHDARLYFVLFGLLYLVSVLWSQQPAGTLGKALEILVAVLISLETSRFPNALERVNALLRIIVFTISAVSLATVLGFLLHVNGFVQQRPGLISSTTAQAPFLSGNGLGYVASALFLVVFAEWQAGRISGRSAMRQMAFAVAIFSVSASRTSFLILVFTVLLIVFRRSKVAAVLGGLVVAAAGFALRQVLLSHLQGHQSASGFGTLSGRTVLWTAALRQFKDHPLLGAGGGIGGKTVIQNLGDIYLQTVSSLHNGFLELLMGLGSIGLLLGLYMLILVTLRAWRAWRVHPEYASLYVLIVHAWLTTIMSTGVLGWMGYEMAFFVCIMTNVDLVRRQDLRQRMAFHRRPVPELEPEPVLAGD